MPGANLGIYLGEIQELGEEIECVHLWLDDIGAPRYETNSEREYSIVGRIKNSLQSDCAALAREVFVQCESCSCDLGIE